MQLLIVIRQILITAVGVQVAIGRLNKSLEKELPDVASVEHGIAFSKLPVIDKISMMVVSQEAILKVVNTNLKEATLRNLLLILNY